MNQTHLSNTTCTDCSCTAFTTPRLRAISVSDDTTMLSLAWNDKQVELLECDNKTIHVKKILFFEGK